MTNQRRGPWLPEEDQQLLALVNAQGASNWVRIAESMKFRTPKQCRERFHQNLKPSLNHEPITPEEGAMIEQMVREMGRRWAEIARRLGNRSDNSVKNWWNGSVNRRRRVHTVGSGSRASTPRSDLHHSYDARYARYSPVGVPYSPPVTEKHIHSGSSSPAYPEYSNWPSSSSSDMWRKQQHRLSYGSTYSYHVDPQLPSPVFTEKSATPASQKPPSLFSSRSSVHSESPVNQSPNMAPMMMMTPVRDESTKIVLPGIDSLTNFDCPRSYVPTTSYERTTLQYRREPSVESSASRPASQPKDNRMSISNLVAH
ncbi:FlbD protein [Ascosphaera apis ARSEF 7405]|uniref:FlbD protein n=1 Tax=Ascosphaera apis ARSEF 7405 TaxID=392613 RepID=A0A167VUM1_9EURO|nr:FlbD protein [Ascosphaera apis ARSEF 7405]